MAQFDNDLMQRVLDLFERAKKEAESKASDKPSPYWQTPSFDTLGDRYNKLNGNQYGDLVELLIGSNKPMSGSAMEDWNKQILDAILQKYFQNDQRAYDRQVLEEQRAYDNPLNALARLTGAGIGRDAAIQLLSGAGSGSGIGSGSGAGVTAPQGIPPSQSTLNSVQAATGIINSISSLVSLGFSIPSAISQAQILGSEAFMSAEQTKGYTSAKRFAETWSNLFTSGEITPDLLDSMSSFDDLLKYTLDHKDDSALKPLFDSGDFQNVYGTTYGREAGNHFWRALKGSQTEGRMLENALRLDDIRTGLAKVNRDSSFLQYNQALRLFEPQIEQFYQDLANGDIQIRIGEKDVAITAEELKQEILQTKMTEYEENQENINNDIFNQTYKGFTTKGGDGQQHDGAYFLSYASWLDLYDQWRQSAVKFQDLSKYQKYLENNRDVMYNVAAIKYLMSNYLADAWDPEKNPNLSAFLNTIQLFNSTGMLNALQLVNKSDSDPMNPRNFMRGALEDGAGRKASRFVRKAAKRKIGGPAAL